MIRRITLVVLAVAALLGSAVGCGRAVDAVRDHGPHQLRPAATTPEPGTRRVVCWMESDHGGVDVALDLPQGFVRDGDCSWHRPVRVPEEDGRTYASTVDLAIGPATTDRSVAGVYRDAKPDAVEDGGDVGDDSILQLELHHDVPALGGAYGDRLSYLCFCDGQNLLSRWAQADGVALSWHTDLPLRVETDPQLEAILSSIGVTDRTPRTPGAASPR